MKGKRPNKNHDRVAIKKGGKSKNESPQEKKSESGVIGGTKKQDQKSGGTQRKGPMKEPKSQGEQKQCQKNERGRMEGVQKKRSATKLESQGEQKQKLKNGQAKMGVQKTITMGGAPVQPGEQASEGSQQLLLQQILWWNYLAAMVQRGPLPLLSQQVL